MRCTQSFLKNRARRSGESLRRREEVSGLSCRRQVTEAQQKIVDYLKKWVTKYEDGMTKITLASRSLYNEKKYPEAYALGKEILTAEPENLKVLVDLGANGYLVAPLNNPALNAEVSEYAQKALAAARLRKDR